MIIGIHGKKQSGKDTVAQIIQYLMYCKDAGRMAFSSYLLLPAPSANWDIVRFADKVKDIVCLIIGCTREQLEDEVFKNTELGDEWNSVKVQLKDYDPFGAMYYYNRLFLTINDFNNWYKSESDSVLYIKDTLIKLTPRKLLQLVGTDCGRNVIHPDIWVNATMRDYRAVNIISHPSDDDMPLSVPSYDEIVYPNWIIPDLRFPNEHKAIRERGGIVIKLTRNSDSADTHESETALDNERFWNHVINNNGTIDDLIEQVKQMLIKENLI